MKKSSALWLSLPVLLASLLFSGQAAAAPEEIQVYLDEFADKGEFGLDIHTNYVLTTQPGIPTVNRKMLRATPELSYGINKNWEVAGYWLTSKGPDQSNGHFLSDGIKARVK